MITFWIMAAIAVCLALVNWQQHRRRIEAEEIATGLARRLRHSNARERATREVVHMVSSVKEIVDDSRLHGALVKFNQVMKHAAVDELENIVKTEDPGISIKIDDLLRRTDL